MVVRMLVAMASTSAVAVELGSSLRKRFSGSMKKNKKPQDDSTQSNMDSSLHPPFVSTRAMSPRPKYQVNSKPTNKPIRKTGFIDRMKDILMFWTSVFSFLVGTWIDAFVKLVAAVCKVVNPLILIVGVLLAVYTSGTFDYNDLDLSVDETANTYVGLDNNMIIPNLDFITDEFLSVVSPSVNVTEESSSKLFLDLLMQNDSSASDISISSETDVSSSSNVLFLFATGLTYLFSFGWNVATFPFYCIWCLITHKYFWLICWIALFNLEKFMLYPGTWLRQLTVNETLENHDEEFVNLGYKSERMAFDNGQMAYLLLPQNTNSVRRVWTLIGGNGMIATDWLPWIKMYVEKANDSSVGFLLLDFPGYNESSGWPSPASALTAHKTAISKLQSILKTRHSNSDDVKIGLLGHSLGCAAVLQLAADPSIAKQEHVADKIIISSPFLSIEHMAQKMFSSVSPLLAKCVIRHKWDNGDCVQRLPTKTNLTIIHSRSDTICPFSHGEKLSELAKERNINVDFRPKVWDGHNDILDRSRDLFFRKMKE